MKILQKKLPTVEEALQYSSSDRTQVKCKHKVA